METLLERSGFECLNGYENLYKINRQGEIWSCWYKKLMTPHITGDGYFKICLKKDGKSHNCFIHRLLAIQYIPNLTNAPTVDHIDRNKSNNCLENLRWATMVEQANNKSTTIVYIVIVLLKDGGFNIQYDGENTSSVELDEEIQFINYYNKKINEILHIN